MGATSNKFQSPEETIHGHGLRMTDQRRAVFDVLMGERDHPTAVEVFTRVRAKVQNISLATVYNCLDTLTACGLVKTVAHERESARSDGALPTTRRRSRVRIAAPASRIETTPAVPAKTVATAAAEPSPPALTECLRHGA